MLNMIFIVGIPIDCLRLMRKVLTSRGLMGSGVPVSDKGMNCGSSSNLLWKSTAFNTLTETDVM